MEALKLPSPFDYGDDYGSGLEPYTELELELLGLLGAIKAKPEWHRKVFDDAVVAKWRTEVSGEWTATGPEVP